MNPYEKFLSGQEERKLEWKAQHAAKKAKTDNITTETIERSSDKQNQAQDQVSLSRKELDAKTDKCQQLKSQLPKAVETNAEALKAQLTVQGNFSKVSVEPYIARYQKLICSENVTGLKFQIRARLLVFWSCSITKDLLSFCVFYARIIKVHLLTSLSFNY